MSKKSKNIIFCWICDLGDIGLISILFNFDILQLGNWACIENTWGRQSWRILIGRTMPSITYQANIMPIFDIVHCGPFKRHANNCKMSKNSLKFVFNLEYILFLNDQNADVCKMSKRILYVWKQEKTEQTLTYTEQ